MAVFVSSRLHSYVCCLLFIVISQASAQPRFLDSFCLIGEGNFTANSTYHTNLNTLLSNLTSNTQIDYGFYNRSYGENSEKVYGIGLCRGDVKTDECRSCINNSTVLLTQLCPNQKEAIAWYDKCMLRYSNRSIVGLMETLPLFYTLELANATNVDQFNQVLDNLVENLTGIAAASGDSRRKYAAGNATATNLETTIYGVAQCTPDLSQQDCNRCLVDAFSRIASSGKISGRVSTPSCNIRYETFRFYDEPSTTADAPAPSL
ncbi:cysteine-rich receptor-like protein kinase 29 [Vigna radiata var. radiata]|uniref:Cysteine-rich receptor-like protein kinase 29 n=1 Tax=Vigna radiata var. radiata TaxID=3916 RepID=A0A1S3V197_VIGRR|nr:cysteine-rich receptor-like protein kinase 29 [Vigna radiata var. radiata]